MNKKVNRLLEGALLPLPRAVRRRGTLNAFLIALVIAVIIVSLSAIYLSQELQAVSLCIGVLVALVLACITFLYVRTRAHVPVAYEDVKIRQEQLALLRGQIKRDRKVKFTFTLCHDNQRAFFCVSNLGRVPILLERYRVSNGQQQITHNVQELLPEGREVRMEITDALTEAQMYWGDVEIAFDYRFAGRFAFSGWHGFNFLNDKGQVRRVRPGMHEPQMVSCPICEWGVLMTAEGLSRLHQKANRAARTRNQIARTCPDHKFDWQY
jgi:hypothetical protein